jgi:hypothetical protein
MRGEESVRKMLMIQAQHTPRSSYASPAGNPATPGRAAIRTIIASVRQQRIVVPFALAVVSPGTGPASPYCIVDISRGLHPVAP